MSDAVGLVDVADVDSHRLARTYAAAALLAAEKQGVADEFLHQLEGLLGSPGAEPGPFEASIGRAIPKDKRASVVDAALKDRALPVLTDFVQVVVRHERGELLRAIAVALRELLDQRRRRVRVRVQSAVELPGFAREKLANELKQLIQPAPNEVALDVRVDPSLLGGMIVNVNGKVFDGSVRTRLDTLRAQLLTRSSHEIQRQRDRVGTDAGS
jgi:F-type H+-transporting ATPase subunit delta